MVWKNSTKISGFGGQGLGLTALKLENHVYAWNLKHTLLKWLFQFDDSISLH